MTLDEWADKNASFLRENLKANIEVYCDHLDGASQADLLRMHLIMIRQWKENASSEPRHVPEEPILHGLRDHDVYDRPAETALNSFGDYIRAWSCGVDHGTWLFPPGAEVVCPCGKLVQPVPVKTTSKEIK